MSLFALEKFRPYLLGDKVTIYSDYSAVKHLLSKKDSKPKLFRWVLLFSDLQIEIKNKPGDEN